MVNGHASDCQIYQGGIDWGVKVPCHISHFGHYFLKVAITVTVSNANYCVIYFEITYFEVFRIIPISSGLHRRKRYAIN